MMMMTTMMMMMDKTKINTRGVADSGKMLDCNARGREFKSWSGQIK